ncbi:MAG: GMC family oxidoreductase N-terminal domain-containing protein [Ktedonobacteraceae bacterium]
MAVTSSHIQEAGQDWLSPEEMHVLEVVCDTLLPALEPPPGSFEEVAAYYRRAASDLHVGLLVAETLGQEHAQAREQFRQLLRLLSNSVLGVTLIGKASPFVKLPLEQRERYLLALANSPLGQLRQGYQAMKRLAAFVFYAAPVEQGVNPNWAAIDYTPPVPTPPTTSQPIQPYAITGDTMLEADVVVVGSGAGGGVVAGELAMAGKSVIVLEKGGYHNEANFTLQEAQAMPELYLKRGTLTSKDLGVIVLAGSTLGGGTVVNWTTSFRTPESILEEWDESSGLRGWFTDASLQESFAAIEQRINVNADNSQHNTQNQLLSDGCAALGYHIGVLRRNAIGCEQRCGTCGFGCRYGAKQSTMKTYLQDAYDREARIIVHCAVDRVLIENERAVGVKAIVTDQAAGKTYNLTARARAVIVAAGTINSPVILTRSGLDNPHIGRHLKLHPVTTIAGVYPDKVYCWQGVMQSAYCDEFGYLDGNYGYKLEVPPAHPGLLGLSTPWYGARDYREQMLQAANITTFIILTRDKGEGRVVIGPDGEAQIDYVVSAYDRRHLLHGLRQAARVHLAAGATSILSLHNKRTRLDRPRGGEVSALQLHEFDRQLERHGMGPNRVMMFTAHQMGTCRMGADPRRAVTDEHAQVYGVKGLFVCDGSLFPAASGVNPMLSIMGLAHRASQYIKTAV